MGKSKDLASGNSAAYVETAGDTMTGRLHISGNTNSYSSSPILQFDTTSTNANNRKWAVGPADDSYGNFHIFKSESQSDTAPVDAAGRTLTITKDGYVTTPYQPAFSTRGTSYTQANASFSIVKPATTDLNVGSHYNSSTGVWTVPVAGNYLVTANGLAYPTGTGGSGVVFNTAWYKNGSQWEDIQNGEYYSNHSSFINTAIIPCAANDTLDFRFYRASGSVTAYAGQFNMYGYLLG